MPYRSQQKLVAFLQVSLGIWLLGTALTIGVMIELLPLTTVSGSGPMSVLWSAFTVATFGLWIGFPVFFYRARKNLDALGVQGLTYSPGQAAWGFYIPFVNLVRPYRVAAELVRASDPEKDQTYATSWMTSEAPRWVLGWFITFMLANVSVRMSPGFTPWSGPMQLFLDMLYVLLGLKVLAMLPAAWLARKLLLTVHQGQEQLANPETRPDWLREGLGHVAEQDAEAAA